MTETHAELLDAAMRDYYRGDLGLPDRQFEESVRTRLEMTRGRRVADLLERELPLAEALLLDVGSGWGEVTFQCRERGARAFGVEPSAQSVGVGGALARERASAGWFVQGTGERLPFEDQAFDVVVCHHVIEHVRSVPATLRELVRVTREGGRILLAFPNYAFPFEGHYRLPWVPLLPKRLGALVLRALGRDPEFLLRSVNYVTYRAIARQLERMPVEVRSLTEERRSRARARGSVGRRLFEWAIHALRAYPTVTLLLTRRPGHPS